MEEEENECRLKEKASFGKDFFDKVSREHEGESRSREKFDY
jgi:hypothetical protein